MKNINYKEKLLELSSEVKKLIDMSSKDGEINSLLNVLHKMIYYAEQFFIELELKYRNNPDIKSKILHDREQVVKSLEKFASVANMYKKNLYEILEFLNYWESRINEVKV